MRGIVIGIQNAENVEFGTWNLELKKEMTVSIDNQGTVVWHYETTATITKLLLQGTCGYKLGAKAI